MEHDEDAIAYPPGPRRPPGALRPWLLGALAACIFMPALSWFAWDWLAPDICLDSGGNFDYRAWRCTRAAAQPYVDVHFAERASSWVLLLAAGLAVLLVAGAVRDARRRGGAAEPAVQGPAWARGSALPRANAAACAPAILPNAVPTAMPMPAT